MQTKTCTKCGAEKPISEFSKENHGKYGVRARCKVCSADYHAEWSRKNRERILNDKVEYYLANKEYISERTREYRRENKEHVAKLKAKYYQATKDRFAERKAEYNAEYYQANKERDAKRNAEYRLANRDRITEHGRNRRALKRDAQGTHTLEDVKRILEIQNGYCAYCEADLEPTGYHVDHIRPLSRGGRNDIINLVCACPTCNLSKSDKTLPEWFDYLEAINRLTDTLAMNIIAVHEQWIQDHSDKNGQISLFG